MACTAAPCRARSAWTSAGAPAGTAKRPDPPPGSAAYKAHAPSCAKHDRPASRLAHEHLAVQRVSTLEPEPHLRHVAALVAVVGGELAPCTPTQDARQRRQQVAR